MEKLMNKEKPTKEGSRKLPKRQMTVRDFHHMNTPINLLDSLELPPILKQAFKLKIILINVFIKKHLKDLVTIINKVSNCEWTKLRAILEGNDFPSLSVIEKYILHSPVTEDQINHTLSEFLIYLKDKRINKGIFADEVAKTEATHYIIRTTFSNCMNFKELDDKEDEKEKEKDDQGIISLNNSSREKEIRDHIFKSTDSLNTKSSKNKFKYSNIKSLIRANLRYEKSKSNLKSVYTKTKGESPLKHKFNQLSKLSNNILNMEFIKPKTIHLPRVNSRQLFSPSKYLMFDRPVEISSRAINTKSLFDNH